MQFMVNTVIGQRARPEDPGLEFPRCLSVSALSAKSGVEMLRDRKQHLN
jgi:hypothetical protein